MKSDGLFELAELLCLLALAHSTIADGRFLEVPLRRGGRAAPPASLYKRKDSISLGRAYDNNSYILDVRIGHPAQNISVGVDIGSYITTVLDSCSSLFFDQDKCQGFGTYNESLSDTKTFLSGDDSFQFDDGSSFELSYYADEFIITGEGKLEHRFFPIEI
jgi:hypothetical protein